MFGGQTVGPTARSRVPTKCPCEISLIDSGAGAAPAVRRERGGQPGDIGRPEALASMKVRWISLAPGALGSMNSCTV